MVGHLLCLSGTATDLRQQKVNTKGSILVLEITLQFGDLLSQHVRRVSNTSNNAQASGVGDSSGKLRTSGDVHSGKHDRVIDLQEIGRCGSDLLYIGSATVGLCLVSFLTRRRHVDC